VATGNLVLVDEDHLYNSADSAETVRVKDYNTNRLSFVSSSKIHMNFVALRKMQEMTAAMQGALNVNYLYCIQSGFVTNEEMATLHANYPREYPDAEGTSELHTGLAATLSVYTGAMNYGLRNKAVANIANWTDENAHKYGFVMGEDVGENGQMRYVGVPHATYMKKNSLDLAGYLAVLQNGEPLQITDDGGLNWTVYRVAASEGESTEIQVPTGMVYDISGDNNGGFIVTVKGVCPAA
jgi:D-alanyl-D-alanine carboxypeptidase